MVELKTCMGAKAEDGVYQEDVNVLKRENDKWSVAVQYGLIMMHDTVW